jgi:hypothetical protein
MAHYYRLASEGRQRSKKYIKDVKHIGKQIYISLCQTCLKVLLQASKAKCSPVCMQYTRTACTQFRPSSRLMQPHLSSAFCGWRGGGACHIGTQGVGRYILYMTSYTQHKALLSRFLMKVNSFWCGRGARNHLRCLEKPHAALHHPSLGLQHGFALRPRNLL